MRIAYYLITTTACISLSMICQAQTATVYTTAMANDTRYQKSIISPVKSEQPTEDKYSVYVDPLHHFQTYIGFGGAITDASAEVFAKLPKDAQKELLSAYYDKENGLAYNIIRSNIQSCDFSPYSYSYWEENDISLSSFSIEHDKQYRIPLIKKAIKSIGNGSIFYVAPWSPPLWMKDNRSIIRGGKLLPAYKQLWAECFVQFIKAYEAEGIKVWGLSTQNEPMATQTWESCIYTAQDECDFIKNNLGPTLKKNKLGDKKIIIWDHNRDLIYHRAATILNDPEAAKYVWGVGFHWYETWTKSPMYFENLRRVKESFPDKELIFTEGCVEKFDLNNINDWSIGERYGYSMINDFNCGTSAWTDWNILLDEKGGPNHVQNYCFAPIHGNTKTGKLMYTNSYYYIGHFSKFIKPGAVRIACASSRAELYCTAAMNPDNSIVVICMNKENKEIEFSMQMGDNTYNCILPAHSISTTCIKK